MRHLEKKYEVKDFVAIRQKLQTLGITWTHHARSEHYYAKHSGNDVVKLVHSKNKDEIHLLKESVGTFNLTKIIPVDNIESGLKWLKDKGYEDVQTIKMEHSDYPYKGGIIGLYLINDSLHAIILDFPPNQHEAIAKELDLVNVPVIDTPFNKHLNKRLAIDIVILPPDEVMDRAVQINTEYPPYKFLLNKKYRLPHITLAQAVINESDLEKALEILKAIGKEQKPLLLETKLTNHPSFLMFVAKNNKLLTELHIKIMKQFEHLVSYDVTPEDFYDKNVRNRTVAWVRDFKQNAAFDNYFPHITLGTSQQVDRQEALNFMANRLAICHLGEYNTCRKILFETSLGAA